MNHCRIEHKQKCLRLSQVSSMRRLCIFRNWQEMLSRIVVHHNHRRCAALPRNAKEHRLRHDVNSRSNFDLVIPITARDFCFERLSHCTACAKQTGLISMQEGIQSWFYVNPRTTILASIFSQRPTRCAEQTTLAATRRTDY